MMTSKETRRRMRAEMMRALWTEFNEFDSFDVEIEDGDETSDFYCVVKAYRDEDGKGCSFAEAFGDGADELMHEIAPRLRRRLAQRMANVAKKEA